MSKNGSMKESILSIFLKKHPQLLQESLGFPIDNITLEPRIAYNNIDIRGVDSLRRIPVFIEVQITKANRKYLNRIKEMIEKYNESVIVWIARSFDEEIMNELKEWLALHPKKFVDVYALSLHKDTTSVLKRLNEMHNLDVYENLHLLAELNPLLTVELENKQIHSQHCGQMNTNPPTIDYNRPEDVKRALLRKLRTRIPYFLNFHYDKKTNQNDRILTIGAGKSGIIYRCSAKDVRNLAFVEIYFDIAENDWYEAFKGIEKELVATIDKDLCFEKRRIGVYFKPEEDYEQTFVKIAEVFRKMIDGFSPYVLGRKEIGMAVSVEDQEEYIMKKFVQVPIELPEQPFPTEESYRVQMEELSELLLTK
ncbi:hypothetical protein [Heyndrickxia oleronia]|jgi:sugar-specific transcriptional regulator TrmB|uniref:hypothetical protein n=1 Tax=Heyndrickxia oleronia TaxID=38875 RepID=UPI00242AF982|nr:hypothetical protein [Heyndrickxia oleronia]MCI1589812.1 hypothetical protein [Heyndrickxia oleronia]MCI1613480.1 hypothetical protein [Heyndrickxia oleronia]MCI1744405.1 hypothetical protein [Heyndrickxia oleronia]MCI1763032.1 hypothetical protein [Heyndrickxia oleronia]